MKAKAKGLILTLFVLLLLTVGILMVAGFASLFGEYWEWALGGLVVLAFVCIVLFLMYKDK